jgi:hypothetical protein
VPDSQPLSVYVWLGGAAADWLCDVSVSGASVRVQCWHGCVCMTTYTAMLGNIQSRPVGSHQDDVESASKGGVRWQVFTVQWETFGCTCALIHGKRCAHHTIQAAGDVQQAGAELISYMQTVC